MIAALSLLILAQLSPTPAARVVRQVGGDWQATYTFRLPPTAPAPLAVAPADLSVRVSGSVHNPRPAVPGRPAAHDGWRPAVHTLEGYGAASAVLLHGEPDRSDKCQERATVVFWSDTAGAIDYGRRVPVVGPPPPDAGLAEVPGESAAPAAVTVQPGGVLRIRIWLRHEHELTDGLDPLLGSRPVVVKVGDWTYRDVLDLAREQYFHLPELVYRPMANIDRARLDDVTYFSAPDSLVLDAGEPGAQYHRLPERKVRGGVKLKLSFRYLVMPGTEGEPRVRVAQYRESRDQWRVLSEAGFERVLPKPVERKASRKGVAGKPPEVGWRLFEEVWTTHPEANIVAVDFRISDSECGLIWLDDIAVDYVGVSNGGPSTKP